MNDTAFGAACRQLPRYVIVSLRPNSLAELLQSWPRAAIFDDRSSFASSGQTDVLESAGIGVLDDRLEAMICVTDSAAFAPSMETMRPFPALLQELPERWLGREGPSASGLERARCGRAETMIDGLAGGT